MSRFLFLNLLFLIQPAFQLSDNDIFLIYNENLNLCIQPVKSRAIVLDKCNKHSEWQQFKWVSNDRLLNIAVKLCLTVPSRSNAVPITLSRCNETNELQKWECRNDSLLALAKQNLFLHPINGRMGNITVFANATLKGAWKIFGTKESLCSKGYEALFTIEGNSFGAPCIFPFKYMNNWYATCITNDDINVQLWCGTTADVDKDSLTGYCPVNDKYDGFFWFKNRWTGNLYQLNSQSALTWDEARRSCQQQSAELLSITDVFEQAYLAGLRDNLKTYYWIGLNNPGLDSGWRWINDHPLRYFNWAPGSPSLETGKNCGLMHSMNGKWTNHMCANKFGYICKRSNFSPDAPVTPSDAPKSIKCPDGWVGYANHCYHLNRDRKTWKAASVSCKKYGGDLISIHNIEEFSFVFSQLGYKPNDYLWIGLNDQKTASYFEWSDGSTVQFTRWQQGEPTLISNVQEDCVIMSGTNGYWADRFCEEELGYVCKKQPLEFLPETDDVADPNCQNGWKRYGYYCYFIGLTPGTFSEAKATCEANKGFLISVENRFEQAYLTSLIGLRSEKYFWIGLSDVENPGTFNWTNGDDIQFTHWNAKMPGPNPGCVAMRTGNAAGLWDVVNCEEKAAFLCKQLAEGATLPPAPRKILLPPCPEGWIASKTRNVCFKVYKEAKPEKKSWFEAQDFCREIGGDLASIHSAEEASLLVEVLSEEDAWIGLRSVESDTGVTWSDRSPVNYELVYDWPLDSGSEFNEYCKILLGYFGRWKSLSCYQLFNWICQITRGIHLNPEPSNKFDYSYKTIEDGWILFENNEYYFSNGSMPADKARKFCKQHGGDLTTIESKQEKIFLWKYVVSYGLQDDFYIGLILGLDRKFVWMDGTPVTYESWAPNEPNFANDDENCVVIYYDTGLWNDINCGVENGFICERHNSSVRTTAAPTPPAPQKGCSEGWRWFNNKCFQIFGLKEDERKNWTDAREACRKLKGNLATIPNQAVQAFLTVHLKTAPADPWIGLNDKNWEERFLWTDGSGVYYTNWAKGSPHVRNGDCVFMMRKPERLAGLWRDEYCSVQRSYICQKNTDSLYYSETTVPTSGYITYGNSSYSIVSPKMTWEEARKKCESENSKLASIVDPYVQSFIWLQVFRYKEPVWIGLNSNVTNNIYKWISNQRLVYTKWGADEPMHKIACVYLDTDGSWKTGNCGKKYFSVCEKYYGEIPTEIPEFPGKCPTSKESQRSWIPFRAHCYSFSPFKESWPTASLKCAQRGGTLTSVEDSTELKFLMEEMERFEISEYWIGLFKNVDGEWLWQDKSEVAFVNWNTEQHELEYFDPISDDSIRFRENCIFMNGLSGKWFKEHCHGFTFKGYICKRHKIIEEPTIKLTERPDIIGNQKKAPVLAHGTVTTVVTLIIAILIISAGITVNVFYKRRNRQQYVSGGFDNSLYADNEVILQTDSEYLVDNKELN